MRKTDDASGEPVLRWIDGLGPYRLGDCGAFTVQGAAMPPYRPDHTPGGSLFFTVVTERRQPVLTGPCVDSSTGRRAGPGRRSTGGWRPACRRRIARVAGRTRPTRLARQAAAIVRHASAHAWQASAQARQCACSCWLHSLPQASQASAQASAQALQAWTQSVLGMWPIVVSRGGNHMRASRAPRARLGGPRRGARCGQGAGWKFTRRISTMRSSPSRRSTRPSTSS